MSRKAAVIGAGAGGMAAAHDLINAGYEVFIYEKENRPGGLAAGFKTDDWDWSLEKFYHHWFQSDDAILSLIDELNLSDKVEFHRPKTVVYYEENFYPLDSPIAALAFPGFSLIDKMRFGFVTVFLRYLASWKPLEKYTAHEWMRKYYGRKVYETLFEPLLIGKFSEYYKKVNMAWFWARFKVRTPKLGTYRGGFQAFLDDFASNLKSRGVIFHFNTGIQKVLPLEDGKVSVFLEGHEERFDQVIAAVPPKVLGFLAPTLDKPYREKIDALEGIGAVVVILTLKNQLSEDGYYWFNLPKTAGFPFLALVEHTNFVSPDHFNDDHIIYCGDYLEKSHEYFSMTKEQLVERFLPSLKRINPKFQKDWVKESWLFRTPFAQPIPFINHSKNIPEIRTPVRNLYLASMSQVYPWDRGTNFAVILGRKSASLMISDSEGQIQN